MPDQYDQLNETMDGWRQEMRLLLATLPPGGGVGEIIKALGDDLDRQTDPKVRIGLLGSLLGITELIVRDEAKRQQEQT